MIETLSISAVKKLVRTRDGNACTACGMSNKDCVAVFGRGLHVHRIVPGSRYTVDGCTLLCRKYHYLAHGCANVSTSRIESKPGPRKFNAGFMVDADTVETLTEILEAVPFIDSRSAAIRWLAREWRTWCGKKS